MVLQKGLLPTRQDREPIIELHTLKSTVPVAAGLGQSVPRAADRRRVRANAGAAPSGRV